MRKILALALALIMVLTVAAVFAENPGELAAGGLVLGEERGREGMGGGESVDEPFERDAVVEVENLAKALGELLVAHGGGVGDGDAAVGEPAFHAAGTGAEYGFAAGKSGSGDGVVERGIEVGQAGSEAQAVAEGAGGGGTPSRGAAWAKAQS